MRTRDLATVDGFGQEWSAFDQSGLDDATLESLFRTYFSLFPWQKLAPDALGVDVGCGSGRWARFVADRVGSLICVDPSRAALAVTARALAGHQNCFLLEGAAGELPLRHGSLDFGYSIGVLHHTPNPAIALRDCVAKLRHGAPFLVYLYYAFDNRPPWFRRLWRLSDIGRRVVSRLPFRMRYWLSQVIAAIVYWPLSNLAAFVERRGGKPTSIPLAAYSKRPFYVMRNDALDRFGTRLEHRFTAVGVESLLMEAGLTDIHLADEPPYWVAIGTRR